MIQWTNRYVKVPISALLLISVASGCSSSKASPPTTLRPLITGVRASTTTTAATTVPVATTTPPSSLPTATTTAVSTEAQVRAAIVELRAAYWACYRDPWNCRPADFTEPNSPAFAASVTSLDKAISAREYVGPEDIGYMTVTKVEPVDGYQLVTTCSYTTGFVYVRAPDGSGQADQRLPNISETIINTWQLVQDKVDQRWKLRQLNELSTVRDVNQCPPKG
jgi:hypothetical protein